MSLRYYCDCRFFLVLQTVIYYDNATINNVSISRIMIAYLFYDLSENLISLEIFQQIYITVDNIAVTYIGNIDENL